jgi:hypothetical protein
MTISITRRTLVRAFPLFGAAVAAPALLPAALASEPQSIQERFDHHFTGLVALLKETAGPCDGFSFHMSIDPLHGKLFHQARRSWILNEHIRNDFYMAVERSSQFHPVTGAHDGYDPMPDLSDWTPRKEGAA